MEGAIFSKLRYNKNIARATLERAGIGESVMQRLTVRQQYIHSLAAVVVNMPGHTPLGTDVLRRLFELFPVPLQVQLASDVPNFATTELMHQLTDEVTDRLNELGEGYETGAGDLNFVLSVCGLPKAPYAEVEYDKPVHTLLTIIDYLSWFLDYPGVRIFVPGQR